MIRKTREDILGKKKKDNPRRGIRNKGVMVKKKRRKGKGAIKKMKKEEKTTKTDREELETGINNGKEKEGY